MAQATENGLGLAFADGVARWVGRCQRRAAMVLVATLVLSAGAVFYLANNLTIDTDTEDMLSADLTFRQNAIKLDDAFPQLEDNLLVVLEAPDPDAADDGARRLAAAMSARGDVFENVFSPETDPFLRKHGLLYLEPPELDALAARLAAAQPFLGTLWQQPNMAGLADMLELLGQAGETGTLDEAAAVIDRMADVAEGVKRGEGGALVWSELLLGKEPSTGPVRRLIQTRPKLDYGSLHPASRASETVMEIAEREGLVGSGYRIRLTGSAALESDELKSVEIGMGVAGAISITVVIAVLLFGLRSPGIMVSLFITLLAGLLWTAALAILLLGSLNLISVAFAVLFVGLSVDFGIHFSLRASEHVRDGVTWREAIVRGGQGVGASLAVCALTTAIAFFSFLPTNYVGLAELGLIAGIGMFVALFCNLTVLPAVLGVLVRRAPALRDPRRFEIPGVSRRITARGIVAIGILSAIVSGMLATGARFDFDPMNLKDQNAPSVETLFDLMNDGSIHPYSAEVLADGLDAADMLSGKLAGLDTVDRVDSIRSLIPTEQETKLATVNRMALFLGPAFFTPPGTVDLRGRELQTARQNVLAGLENLAGRGDLGKPAARLSAALADADDTRMTSVNAALFRYLPARLNDLLMALEAGPVDVASLPEYLKRRYLSDSGLARLDVVPSVNPRDPDALREFVAEVQAIAPNATGAPVVIVEAGRAVLDAFGHALMVSLAGVGLVLWLVLRRITDVLLVFAPVCVAALWTLAVSALLDVPFNFANVIVLPLLFGLSVDFGIHIVMRQRGTTEGRHAMATTTPRAVLLSALTTLGSFGSIMLSGHPGTASMGLLLTIAVTLSVIAILVLLPALMQLFMRSDEAG